MARVLGALKATYNFFSGDAILLSAAVIAFALGWLLAHLSLLLPHTGDAPDAVVAVVFVGVIVLGLFTTLRREVAGRARQR